jgi:hypothetical protein
MSLTNGSNLAQATIRIVAFGKKIAFPINRDNDKRAILHYPLMILTIYYDELISKKLQYLFRLF